DFPRVNRPRCPPDAHGAYSSVKARHRPATPPGRDERRTSPPSPDEARGPAHSRVQKRGATAMHAQRVVIALLTALAVDDRANAQASPDKLRAAVGKSLPLLERGAAGFAARRECFSCHHQALPVLALAEAKARGFKVDGDGLQGQLGHTAGFLDGN